MKKAIQKKVTKELKKAIGDRNTSKNDKLLAKVLLDKPLTATEQERWERLNFIIDLREKGYPQTNIATICQKRWGLTSATKVYPYIKEATDLFGERQGKINKQAEAALMAEMMMRLHAAAIQGGDLNFAKECLVERAKLLKLYEPERISTPPMMPVIVLSSDERVANKGTIEIEYEEGEAEDVSEQETD